MKKTTTTKEKIAMIWTLPIVAVASIAFAAITFAIYFTIFFFNVTGTTGAAIYIFDRVRLKIIDMRLKKLVKDDEKLHKFDFSKLRKNENTSKTAS